MSTDMVPYQTTGALAPVEAEVMSLTPENLELVQATSRKEGGVVGKIRNLSNDTHLEEIYAVPIAIRTSRALFTDDQSDVLCRSNDGNIPAPNVKQRQSITCATCPKAQWKTVDGKKIKPACVEILTMTLMGRDNFRAYRMPFKRGAAGELRKAFNQISNDVNETLSKLKFLQRKADRGDEAAKAKIEELNNQRLTFADFSLYIKPFKVVQPGQVYYTLRINHIRNEFKTPEDRADYLEMYNDVVTRLRAGFAQRAAQVAADAADSVSEQVDEVVATETDTQFPPAQMEDPVIEG